MCTNSVHNCYGSEDIVYNFQEIQAKKKVAHIQANDLISIEKRKWYKNFVTLPFIWEVEYMKQRRWRRRHTLLPSAKYCLHVVSLLPQVTNVSLCACVFGPYICIEITSTFSTEVYNLRYELCEFWLNHMSNKFLPFLCIFPFDNPPAEQQHTQKNSNT